MATGTVNNVGQSIRVYYFVLRLFGFAPLPLLVTDSGLQPSANRAGTERAWSAAYTGGFVLLYSAIFVAYLTGESFTTNYESFLLSGAELTYCGLLFLNTLFHVLHAWTVRSKARTIVRDLGAVDGELARAGAPVNHQRQYDAIWTGLYLNVVTLCALGQLSAALIELNHGDGWTGKLFYLLVFVLATTVFAVDLLEGIVAVTLVVRRYEALRRLFG